MVLMRMMIMHKVMSLWYHFNEKFLASNQLFCMSTRENVKNISDFFWPDMKNIEYKI